MGGLRGFGDMPPATSTASKLFVAAGVAAVLYYVFAWEPGSGYGRNPARKRTRRSRPLRINEMSDSSLQFELDRFGLIEELDVQSAGTRRKWRNVRDELESRGFDLGARGRWYRHYSRNAQVGFKGTGTGQEHGKRFVSRHSRGSKSTAHRLEKQDEQGVRRAGKKHIREESRGYR